jgi:hypothetical protein
LADWPTLGFVRIEQPIVGKAARNQAEFPSKIPRILNARIHTLRTDRAVDMRRIAGEKDVGAAIPRRLTMMEMKAREPCRVTQADGAGSRRVDKCLQFREFQVADSS